MLTKPGFLLRVEGGLVFAVCILFYRQTHASWALFALLFLAPDISMIGYLRNARLGAAVYNAVHTLAGPLLLLGYATVAKQLSLVPYALIWIAHIGADRLLGFGLKYPAHFKDTHLQHV
jgi:hypothetical protein